MEIDNYEPAVVTDERLFSVRDEIGGGFAVRQGGGGYLALPVFDLADGVVGRIPSLPGVLP